MNEFGSKSSESLNALFFVDSFQKRKKIQMNGNINKNSLQLILNILKYVFYLFPKNETSV